MTPEPVTGIRNCAEVARILTARGEQISPQAVHKAEQKALNKLRRELEPLAVELGWIPKQEQ